MGKGEDNDVIETRDSTCRSYKGTRQYIVINQKAMASTYETTTREPGIMLRRINQSVHQIKPQSVTALSVYHSAAPSNAAPSLIRLSDLHETRQVRASRRSQGR